MTQIQEMRKPRVLMIAPSPGKYGGIEAFTASIARQTLDSGQVDVRLVFRLRKGGELTSNFTDGIATHHVRWRMMRGLDFQYLKDLLWADVVNCHFPLIYATFPAKFLGKKLAVTVENRRFHSHGPLFKVGLKLADARWYISSFVADTWEGARRWKNSMIVPAISKLPSDHVPILDRRGFFFIARWVPLKGLEQLVEAYATAAIDHASHPLALLGDGDLRESIESLIESFGIAEFIDAPGFVDHSEKCRRMASAKWNVAPAAFPEDLGLSPIEARACGVPSIVSDIGGLPEAAGDQALLCQAGDISSLRSAIEQAAGMSDGEYNHRSARCEETLATYLPTDSFYADAFKSLTSQS